MRNLIMTLFMLLSLSVFAQWKIVKKENSEYQIQNDKNHIVNLQTLNGEPLLIKVMNKKIIAPYQLVIYYAGSAGTQYDVEETRAIIYNPKSGKSIGDYPWSYTSTNDKIIQPKWKFTKSKISIIDKESGLEKIIILN